MNIPLKSATVRMWSDDCERYENEQNIGQIFQGGEVLAARTSFVSSPSFSVGTTRNLIGTEGGELAAHSRINQGPETSPQSKAEEY